MGFIINSYGFPSPQNTVLPSISGTANPGETLTGTDGTWTNSPTSYTYQWKREGVDIPGETANTYIVRNNDVGLDITYSVTAINASGASTSTSAATFISAPSLQTEYTAIQTYATTNTLTQPSARQRQFENRLVKFFKSVGIWTNMEIFYNFYTGGASGYSLINWKNPGTRNATVVSAPVFTALSGWAMDGVDDYLNTNFIPSSHVAVASQNNSSVGVYISAGGQSNGQDVGLITTTRRIAINARNTSDQTYANINDNTAGTTANGEATGLYHVFRSTSTHLSSRRNDISLVTSASTSTGLATSNIYIGARNNSGTADLFSNRTIGAMWFGTSMSIYSNQLKSGFKVYRDAMNVSQARGAFGTLINDNFARSTMNSPTADYVTDVSDFSVDGTKLTVTGGVPGFENRLRYQYGNSFEQWDQSIIGVLVSTPGVATTGLGIGISDYSVPDGERSVTCQLTFESGSNLGKIYIWTYDNTSATQRSVSASGLPFASGDTYRIDLDCSIVSGYRVYTATATRNGSSFVQTQWTTANHAEGSSTGEFAIFSFGGTQTVTNWTINVDDIKHVKDLWIGNSITHGHGATTLNTRFADQVSVTDFMVSAGSGDVTQSVLNKLQNILDYNPHRVFLMIGGNDVALGVSSGTYQANYTQIRNALAGHGIEVIHLLATPRDAVNMTTFNSWISSTFTSDTVIDTFTPLATGTALNNTYDLGDGTHLNQAGYNLVASTINAAL